MTRKSALDRSKRQSVARVAGIVSLACGLAGAAFAAEDQLARPHAIAERIQWAFALAGRSYAPAALEAAAWGKFKGRLLAAAVCLGQSEPRLGCAGWQDAEGKPVRSVSIASSAGSELERPELFLDGTWRANEYVLRVDASRAQANVNMDAPFEWHRFIVKWVSEDSVEFAVGADLYRAEMASDRLVLTSTRFRGERVLARP